MKCEPVAHHFDYAKIVDKPLIARPSRINNILDRSSSFYISRGSRPIDLITVYKVAAPSFWQLPCGPKQNNDRLFVKIKVKDQITALDVIDNNSFYFKLSI